MATTKLNARYLSFAHIGELVDLAVCDVSFISVTLILPALACVFHSKTEMVILVKPQFEAGRQQVGRGKGVIRDPAIHRQVLETILAYALQQGYAVRGLIRSPLTGPKGNAEFLVWLEYPGVQLDLLDGFINKVL